SSDSGTLSRVVQSLLSWLSDKEAPVFVIATANDMSKLPSELTRAGRFDEIFFMSLPVESERADILKIHLRKRDYKINETINFNDDKSICEEEIIRLSAEMEGFTGAEIE